MTEIEIDITAGPVRVIPVLATAVDALIINGPCQLCGWSLRDATGDLPAEVEGNVTSPAASGVIATLTGLAAGTYQVNWAVGLEGTLAAGDANNFRIDNTGVPVDFSVNGFAPGLYPQQPFEVTVAAGGNVTVKALAAGTVGAVYSAQISIVPVASGISVGELQDGNNPLGEIQVPNPGVDTHWFGGAGLHVRNRVNLHIISGSLVGVVYARFYAP